MLKKHVGLRLLIAAICLHIGAGAAEAKFRALLVGFDYQNANAMIKPLHGAVNDVNDMRDVMTRTLGIAPDDIRVLTEAQAKRAAPPPVSENNKEAK